ncbi:MAG TPA: PDZ domain-containing protein [Gemmatimonadaceae bacterium]|nr:PDZ domain-containing protein [Gemmatimonadaceae bacterium]
MRTMTERTTSARIRTPHLGRRGLALSGLLMGGALAAAPASAQDAPAATGQRRAEAAMRAELVRVQGEMAAMRKSLDRFEQGRTGPLSQPALDSLQQLVLHLAGLRAQQVQLAQTLRWSSASTLAAEQATVQAHRAEAPSGWLGIVASTNGYATSGREGMVLQAGEYPVIVSVEPGSPAAVAGVLAGDRLLALKGLDVQSQRVPLGTLLRPGTMLPVRVERDGMVRDLNVRITARPRAFPPTVTMRVRTAPDGRFALGEPAPPEPSRPWPAPAAPRAVAATGPASGVVVVPVAPGAPPPEYVPVAPVPPTPAPPGMFGSGATVAVAGAEVARMNGDLRETFGVEHGVLVLNVGRRSPADQAGLRAGDVIVSAGGAEIGTPASLVRAVRAWEGDRLRLEVVRKRQRRAVELRR